MAEKQERDAKGLCYKCDSKWFRGHRCQNILLMFLNDKDRDEPPDQEEANSEEHGQIVSADISSLNSMAGTSTSRSLRIKGSIKGVTVVVLVNGGSSHNVIHPDVVEKLKLEVETVTTFCVYVGNGESLLCSQYCRSVPLELQNHVFGLDLYVLPTHEFTWPGHTRLRGINHGIFMGRTTHKTEGRPTSQPEYHIKQLGSIVCKKPTGSSL